MKARAPYLAKHPNDLGFEDFRAQAGLRPRFGVTDAQPARQWPLQIGDSFTTAAVPGSQRCR